MKSKELQELKHLSALVGKDPLLTQGAGGNTSLKEDGVLWVKASGKWLSHSLEDPVFVSLDLQHVLQVLKENGKEFTLLSQQEDNTLRPSIETTVHAVIPQRVVLHIHSIRTLSFAIRKEGEEELKEKLKGIFWGWIPYYRPGQPLAKAIQKWLPRIPDVLILQNHGLIISGNSCSDAEDLLHEVEKRLDIPTRPVPPFQDLEMKALAQKHDLRLPNDSAIHSLALDPLSLAFAQEGVLYPDQAVFLGAAPSILDPNKSEHFKLTTSYGLVPRKGVLVKPTITPGTEAMLLCHALLLQRLTKNAHLNPLPSEEVRDLMQWDAEKFRQHLDKR